ncbi:YkgJ family cysteine cluster protein [Humisphaera borealis]|uniref:YkgJ family cysteine cluster protein n=1 Tax=Humisphaera borealis TaxID=2807512 RepID=A0A7M2WXY3_9BACT|nr:YkgJ family cysteine cluster protein [Humisphaera borealis]QOV90336.1 YkgJ family cysteine cluster protein [Humisphaera borealis]
MPHIRLAIVGPSPCNRCYAACCKQNGHDWSVLLQTDDERRRFRPWAIDLAVTGDDGAVVVEKVLPYRDGRCIFLGDDDLCQIYEDRPLSCRKFECTGHFNRHGVGKHTRFIDLNPRVREMLESA